MTKAKNPHAFSIARYEAQITRAKRRLAALLISLAYPDHAVSYTDDTCHLLGHSVNAESKAIQNFTSVVCDHVPVSTWLLLKKEDRYQALHLLIPKEYHTPVPGGMVYQVRFTKSKTRPSNSSVDAWVFLTVGHEIGLCKLVPTALAARVF